MDTPGAQEYIGAMGIFGGKTKTATKPRTLKTGACIPMQDVDPDYINWVRQTKPADKTGHHATVRLDLEGDHIVARAGDGTIIGRMEQQRVPLYRREFQTMHARGEYGLAQIEVSKAGNKERIGICINYDEACRDGGIL